MTMLGITPTVRQLTDERRARLARIASRAVPDPGINLKPQIKVCAPPEEVAKPTADDVDRWWVNKQKKIWFSVVEEIDEVGKTPTIAEIQAVVADYFRVTRAALIGPRRTRDIVRPRQIAIYLAKTMTQRSFPEIGRRFGYRDHSTALASVRRINSLLPTNGEIAEAVAELKGRLTA